jgi:hypothetical protein
VVTDTGKTLRPDASKPVNAPEPVKVEEDPGGLPAAVRMKRRQAVAAVEDRWRLDDEWWRRRLVVRLYFSVRLASGHRLVLYKDLATGDWYKQGYQEKNQK